jgi:lysozyme family protein
MASFEQFRQGYASNWAALKIRPERDGAVAARAQTLLRGKPTYQQCETRTQIPWWFFGLCHYRESDFDFNTYLGNGQSLARPTTIVPIGRGPFTGPNAFVDGAVDAMKIQGFIGAQDWSIERVSFRLEGFNGYGYHQFGVNSPYLYGGSTLYGPPEARGGKYVRDHDFRSDVVDTQLGTLVILKKLLQLDPSINLGGTPAGPIPPEPDQQLAHGILWVQQTLNRLGTDPTLTEDGILGPRTMAAIQDFQAENNLPQTGLPDTGTLAALDQKLTAMASPKPAPVQQTFGDQVIAFFKNIFGA